MKINYIESQTPIKVIFMDKEMEAAHEEYKNRKRDMLFKLDKMIFNDELPTIYRNWCEEIYKFVEEER